ncbi:MAG: lysophospholipid acyltransferase family protein [Candidatus Omnitrophica bacterium]|nr:lysophospholipid acyltransferase family protein [Candidatus Omnitrophota bacterium]
MLFLLYKAGIFLAENLPPKIGYRVAEVVGSLYYLFARRDRTIVLNNLEVISRYTGNTEKLNNVARCVFVNFARYILEFFRTPKIDLQYIRQNVKIETRDNLNQALKLGKGVLLVGAHLGNWELGATVLSLLGYKISVVAWTHKNRSISNFFLQQRQSKGIGVIPLGTAIRGTQAALKENSSVALLGDVDFAQPERGVPVKLFGRETVMPKGPAVLALRTGAPIVPAFVLREKNNSFRFILGTPMIYSPSGNWEYDSTKLTEALAKVIESYIAQDPGQWFMLTPRWSKR